MLRSALAKQRLDGISAMLPRLSVEGPTPPLIEIDDDVEGVEGDGDGDDDDGDGDGDGDDNDLNISVL